MLRSSYGVLADVRMMLDKIQGRVSKLVCFCAKRPCQKPPENLCWERNRGSITRRELFGQSIQGMGMGPRLHYQHTGFGGSELRAWTYADPGCFSWQRHKCEPWKTSRKRVRILRAFGEMYLACSELHVGSWLVAKNQSISIFGFGFNLLARCNETQTTQ